MECRCDNTAPCRPAGEDARKSATVTLLRSELLYDIANSAFVTGDVIGEENEHAHHLVTDVTQEGNIDRVTRMLDLAFADLDEKLYPYTKGDIEDGTEADDKMGETEKYVLSLSLPSSFSATTLRLVAKLAHEFLVCRVLHDWLGVTSPENAAVWGVRAESVGERLRTALTSRSKAFRRKMKPF